MAGSVCGRYRDVPSGAGSGIGVGTVVGGSGIVGRSSNYDYIACGNDDNDDDVEDYVDEEEEEEVVGDEDDDDDELPTDEDKFERLDTRRHEMHQRMLQSEQRRYRFNRTKSSPMAPNSAAVVCYRKGGAVKPYGRRETDSPNERSLNQDYDFGGINESNYEQPGPVLKMGPNSGLAESSISNRGLKGSVEMGFESDFNQSSPPPIPKAIATSTNYTITSCASVLSTPSPKTTFRFSNDFSTSSEKENRRTAGTELQKSPSAIPIAGNEATGNSGIGNSATSIHRLRFDENVKISQFEDEGAFEDDFSQVSFDTDFNSDSQWEQIPQKSDFMVSSTIATATPTTVAIEQPSNTNYFNKKQIMRTNKLQQRQQEMLKKSDSVNIFGKKCVDPFEDDDFFKTPTENMNTVVEGNVLSTVTTTATTATSLATGVTTMASADLRSKMKGSTLDSEWQEDDDSNFAKFEDNI